MLVCGPLEGSSPDPLQFWEHDPKGPRKSYNINYYYILVSYYQKLDEYFDMIFIIEYKLVIIVVKVIWQQIMLLQCFTLSPNNIIKNLKKKD